MLPFNALMLLVGQQVEQLVIEKVCYNNPEGSALGTLCDLEWL